MVATRWPIEQVSAPVRKLNDDSQQHCSAHSIGAASAVGKHDDNKVFSEISEILLSFVCWMCQRENKPGYMSKCEHNSQQVCFNVFHPTQAAQRQEARLLFGCCWKPWKQNGEIETICQQLCFQHHNLLPLDSGHFILVEKRLTLQNFDCCEITAGKLTLDAHVSQIFS